MKRRMLCLLVCLCLGLCGCRGQESWGKYTVCWLELFDTQIQLTAYAQSQAQFDQAAQEVHALLERLDAVFDAYEPHEGVQGVWAVNQAGGEAVRAESELLELLAQAQEWTGAAQGRVNLVMGSVLSLWHEARETGLLPAAEALAQAAEHMDDTLLHLDLEAGTVSLGDPQAQLDLGAVAKGWAMARAAELLDERLPHYLLNGGGNVVCGLAPMDGREAWSVGVRDPYSDNAADCVQVLELVSCAAVTSGGYQRYVEIDGVRYHHLIDPDTLYPANLHQQATIVCADSALADLLSTAAFLLPSEQAQALAERFGAQCILID